LGRSATAKRKKKLESQGLNFVMNYIRSAAEEVSYTTPNS